MRTRHVERTGWDLAEVGFGSWQLGADWGPVSDGDAIATLHAALGGGVNFIDTADVYGDGRSEQLIARALQGRGGTRPLVATKLGRRSHPHIAASYTRENMTAFVERSLRNLATDALDLVQVHSPPTDVFYQPDTFEALEHLVWQGKIRRYGASVEKVEEGIKALEYPGLASVQIIFNIFRQRPAELFFKLAKERGVAIIARVPLASGLLSGKFTSTTTFDASDHRIYNRHGEAFDVGETFAGVPYEIGLAAVEELRPLVPAGASMAQFALRWILMHDAVSVVIPGAKSIDQARDNLRAAGLPPLSPETMKRVAAIYVARIKPHVHQRW